MVRIQRKQDNYAIMAAQFTWGRHIGNLILMAVIGLLVCVFLILRTKVVSERLLYPVCCVVYLFVLVLSKPALITSHTIYMFYQEQLFASGGGAVHALSMTAMAKKPHLIYGTAWKEDETANLVSAAVKSGFRFIDTACQPKHYNEAGVGNGWTSAAKELGLERSDLWLQTKFTAVGGQDPNNLPYDPKAPLEEQLRTSLATSLKNLKTTYLDSWVMHSPMKTMETTIQAWRVMEEAVDQGKVRQLGMSNCYSLEDFQTIYQQARIKPAVLQNRFYEDSNFDTELRRFCKDQGITYQSFWTLSGNRHALKKQQVKDMAKNHGLTPQTYMYAFLLSLGYVTPLDGTKDPAHMAEDVALMKRIQGGEVLFDGESELRKFAEILGMPDL
jgi:diketogulonate reductase-like aldo/keto reductase